MSSKEFDILIVGAGIVGLATARALKIACPNSEIAVLEKENEIKVVLHDKFILGKCHD